MQICIFQIYCVNRLFTKERIERWNSCGNKKLVVVQRWFSTTNLYHFCSCFLLEAGRHVLTFQTVKFPEKIQQEMLSELFYMGAAILKLLTTKTKIKREIQWKKSFLGFLLSFQTKLYSFKKTKLLDLIDDQIMTLINIHFFYFFLVM